MSHPAAPASAPERCQFWLHGFPSPGRTGRAAAEAEQLGYDGLLLADSQNLVADVFVELAAVAAATTRLGLGTGVTNPVTRHPAVTAAAIATLQAMSGGRAVLGVGRGDSAVTQLGLPGPTTGELERFVGAVRGYLGGESVSAWADSRLHWLDPGLPAVPVEVAATGPATNALAAVHADRLMLTVGADPRAIGHGLAVAREARRAAGLDPDTFAVGAYVNIACHEDVAVARDLVRGSAAIFARFGSGGPASDGYDKRRHGLTAAHSAAALTGGFLDRFAVVGDAERCATRLAELVGLGLDRIVLVPGSRDSDPAVLARSNRLIAEEALPPLRGAGPPSARERIPARS